MYIYSLKYSPNSFAQQGERAVRSYLRRYVRLNDPPLKRELRGGSITESTFPADDMRRKSDPRGKFKDSVERDSNEGSERLTWSNVQKFTQDSSDRHVGSVDGAMSARSAMASPQRSPVLPRMLPPIRIAPPRVVFDDESNRVEETEHSSETAREDFRPIIAERERDTDAAPTRMGSARDLSGSARDLPGSARDLSGSAHDLMGSSRNLGSLGGRLPPIKISPENNTRRTPLDVESVNSDGLNSGYGMGSREPSPRSEGGKSPVRMKRGTRIRHESNHAYDTSELW